MKRVLLTMSLLISSATAFSQGSDAGRSQTYLRGEIATIEITGASAKFLYTKIPTEAEQIGLGIKRKSAGTVQCLEIKHSNTSTMYTCDTQVNLGSSAAG